jgi:hypothetical protein
MNPFILKEHFMPVQFEFNNPRALEDEKILYSTMTDYFNNDHAEKIVITRKTTPDCIMHVLKNMRTRNTVVIKDRRANQGVVNMVVYDRLPHTAENIGHNHRIAVNENFSSMDALTLLDLLKVFLTKESEFSKVPFKKIKATKKKHFDLQSDEVFVARIQSIGNRQFLDIPTVVLYFEQNNGIFMTEPEKIYSITSNPIGSLIVINKQTNFDIYTPDAFQRYFEIVESPLQTSSPMELFKTK